MSEWPTLVLGCMQRSGVPGRPKYIMLCWIIIRATHAQEVLGKKSRRIRELTALVQKRFRFPNSSGLSIN